MPILYDLALSPFGQKVKIALREKAIPFERRLPDDPAHAEDYARGNPRREVPLLVDGDARVWDSTAILDYLDERWPDPPLLPADPAARAEARLLEELADTRLEALNFCLSEARAFPAGEDAAAAAVIGATEAEILRLQAALTDRLGDRDFFGGDAPSRADFSLFSHVNAARVMKIGPADGPLADWLGRMAARPSVAETVGEIRESLPHFKALMAEIRSGARARQFRDHRLDWMIQAGGLPIIARRMAAGGLKFSEAQV